MAFPNVKYNASTGSDTAASGSGPSTAKTGAAATNGAGNIVNLDGSPDLSGITINVDVLWVNSATTNRHLSRITAVDNTGKTVTTEDTLVLSTGVAWAIGGKRKTFKNDTGNYDWKDYKAGWTMTFDTGTYDVPVPIVAPTGDVTNGRVTFQAAAAATPVFDMSGNTYIFNLKAHHSFIGLKFTASGTHTASSVCDAVGANVSAILFKDCIVDGLNRGMNCGTNISNVTLENCEIKNCINEAVYDNGPSSFNLYGCWIHDNGSGIKNNSAAAALCVENCIINNNTADGVYLTVGNNSAFPPKIIKNNVFYKNGDGIHVSGTADATCRIDILNNIITGNTAYGVNCASATQQFVCNIFDFNAYGWTTDPNVTADVLNITKGPNDVALTADPFTAKSTYDFSLNAAAGGGLLCKATGFPQTITGSTTDCNANIGVDLTPVTTAGAPPVYTGMNGGIVREIKRGAAADSGLIFHVFAKDCTTPFGGKTGLVFGDFACRYIRSGETLSGAITTATIATLGTYVEPASNTTIDIKEVSAANAPGLYEVHIHHDWVNTTNACKSLTIFLSATGTEINPQIINLTDYVETDIYGILNNGTYGNSALNTDLDAILTRIPAALSGTGFMKASVQDCAANAITAAAIQDGAIDNATFAGDIGSTGYATNLIALAAFKALEYLNLDHLCKTATAAGDMTTEVTDGTIISRMLSATSDTSTYTAAAFSLEAQMAESATLAEVSTEIWSTHTPRQLTSAQTFDLTGSITGSIVGNLSGSVGSVTGNVGGNVTGSVGSVLALAADCITAASMAASASAEIADAIWDEALSGHVTGGTAGKALADAATAGDPWATSLPGGYSSGQAGYIIGTNLNATITSRLAPTVAARTLDITAGGCAGIDWANVEAPTTVNGLTGTTIAVTQVIASMSGNVGGSVASVAGNVGGNVTGTIGGLATQAKADVNAELVDCLNVDTYAELGSGAPSVTPTFKQMAMQTYMTLVNKLVTSSSEQDLYDTAGTTVLQKRTLSDTGSVLTRGIIVSGP